MGLRYIFMKHKQSLVLFPPMCMNSWFLKWQPTTYYTIHLILGLRWVGAPILHTTFIS